MRTRRSASLLAALVIAAIFAGPVATGHAEVLLPLTFGPGKPSFELTVSPDPSGAVTRVALRMTRAGSAGGLPARSLTVWFGDFWAPDALDGPGDCVAESEESPRLVVHLVKRTGVLTRGLKEQAIPVTGKSTDVVEAVLPLTTLDLQPAICIAASLRGQRPNGTTASRMVPGRSLLEGAFGLSAQRDVYFAALRIGAWITDSSDVVFPVQSGRCTPPRGSLSVRCDLRYRLGRGTGDARLRVIGDVTMNPHTIGNAFRVDSKPKLRFALSWRDCPRYIRDTRRPCRATFTWNGQDRLNARLLRALRRAAAS